MKYLITIIVAIVVFWIALVMLRNTFIYMFVAIPVIVLIAGIYLHFFRPRTDFSFGIFFGALIASIMLSIIIHLFVMFPPFQ